MAIISGEATQSFSFLFPFSTEALIGKKLLFYKRILSLKVDPILEVFVPQGNKQKVIIIYFQF